LSASGILNRFQVSHLFIMGLAGIGLAQIIHLPGAFIRNDQVFIRMGFFFTL
jgi:hypothetical protein